MTPQSHQAEEVKEVQKQAPQPEEPRQTPEERANEYRDNQQQVYKSFLANFEDE